MGILGRCEWSSSAEFTKANMTGKKNKVFALAKGFRGRAKNCWRISMNRVEKALQYQYRDRRTKKREFRSLWIQRINAGARQHDVSYSQMMHGLSQSNIILDRKVLSELAVYEPVSFAAVVDAAKEVDTVQRLSETARNLEASQADSLLMECIRKATRNNPVTAQDTLPEPQAARQFYP